MSLVQTKTGRTPGHIGRHLVMHVGAILPVARVRRRRPVYLALLTHLHERPLELGRSNETISILLYLYLYFDSQQVGLEQVRARATMIPQIAATVGETRPHLTHRS